MTPTPTASLLIAATLSNRFSPCQSRSGSAKLALNNGGSHGRDARRARPNRAPRVSVPRPPRAGAVLLRMLASGICGTDKHTFRGETAQYAGTEHARKTPFPIVQGHENVGLVEAVGPGGARAGDGAELAPGDRVVPAPNRPCGSCRFCTGDFPYYLCERLGKLRNPLPAPHPPHPLRRRG